MVLLDLMPIVSVSMDEGPRELFGTNRICIYEGITEAGWASDRIIDSTFSGGKWTDESLGQPQRFEAELPSPQGSPVLTIARAREYCTRLGIRMFDDGYFGEGVLISRETSSPGFTFAVSQRLLGLNPVV